MNKKMIVAALSMLLGVVCLISYYIVGSKVAADGTLEEPFFLIPLGFLFIFSGLTLAMLTAIIMIIKKYKFNN